MSATPGARNEYSRESRGSSGDFARPDEPRKRAGRQRRAASGGLPRGAAGLVLAGALLGALLLVVAEFTPLYHVHEAGKSAALRTVGTGSNHSYALIPIALLAVFLALAVRGGGGWAALTGVGVAGLAAFLIAILVDLPDAHRKGFNAHFIQITSTASAGLYMETLGAVILIATCGVGLLLLRQPAGSA